MWMNVELPMGVIIQETVKLGEDETRGVSPPQIHGL